jgi:hypothetical protein
MSKTIWTLGAIGAATLAALLNPIAGQPPPLSSSERAEVVRLAVGELGKTDPTPYIASALGRANTGRLEWCGLFGLWALHQAGLVPDWLWSFDPDAPGFLYRLPRVDTLNIKPGDFAYFDRPYQHHAVVEAVDQEKGMVSTINGNGAGGAVTRVVRPISDADGYYTIDPILLPRAA